MRDNGLVHTQVTESLVKLLRRIRDELEKKELIKKRKRIRITKREVSQELVRRCIIKRVI